MTRAERLARLQLACSDGVGPRNFNRLIQLCGSAIEALDAQPQLSARGGRKSPLHRCSTDDPETDMATVTDLGSQTIVIGEDDNPETLAAIHDPPPVESVLGDPALLHQTSVAMVGARNAPAGGRKFARGLALDIGGAGIVVSSSMARGIDRAAREGALATGTVAVMAGGVESPNRRKFSICMASI